MMPVGSERRYSVEDYFSVEESSPVRHEFVAGQIFAMAGASLRHNRITGNVFAELRTALAGRGCDVFATDLRVRTPSGLYTYPDVMVVCGSVQLSADDRLETVVNPAVLVEVLSASTAAYDRGEKFRHYRSFPALREYLLIEQSLMRVEHHHRGDGREATAWNRHDYSAAADAVVLSSLGIEVALAGIYAGVTPGPPS
jgi:Uma2 family endonuclease